MGGRGPLRQVLIQGLASRPARTSRQVRLGSPCARQALGQKLGPPNIARLGLGSRSPATRPWVALRAAKGLPFALCLGKGLATLGSPCARLALCLGEAGPALCLATMAGASEVQSSVTCLAARLHWSHFLVTLLVLQHGGLQLRRLRPSTSLATHDALIITTTGQYAVRQQAVDRTAKARLDRSSKSSSRGEQGFTASRLGVRMQSGSVS